MKREKDPIEALKRFGQENNIFFFKQFRIEDDRSTMKVGTDAVLLGIATDTTGAETILEVGTGCGVISLILAQRSSALIDAIEIDEGSVAQAGENVTNSPWAGRIRIIRSSLQAYFRNCPIRYDLMVSNPPFFSRSFRSEVERRNLSRHDDLLTFEELITASGHLLRPEGRLWVILPARESLQFRRLALSGGFYPQYIRYIIPKEGKEPNRLIMGFGRYRATSIHETSLTLRDRWNDFSEQYRQFAKDFYIDF